MSVWYALSMIVFICSIGSLLLLLVFGELGRRRLYFSIFFAPVLLMLLQYLHGDPYFMFYFGFVCIAPLSLLLMLVGIVLVVRARARSQAWGGLAFSALFAASPAFFFIGLIVLSL